MKKYILSAALILPILIAVLLLPAKSAHADTGTLIYATGTPVLSTPYAVAISTTTGNVYITGINKIEIRNSSGGYIGQFGSQGTNPGQFDFRSFSGLAFDTAGNLLVLDSGNNRVQKFSPSGVYISQIQFTVGTGSGQFNDGPSAITVDPLGNIYLGDNGNFRIQKFSPSGVFLAKFGTYGTGNSQFSNLEGIAADSQGNIYAVDSGYYSGGSGVIRVIKFNSSGGYVTQFGSADPYFPVDDGKFIFPIGIGIDKRSGNVVVTDYTVGRVQIFDSIGNYLAKAQSPHHNQFSLVGVAVAASGEIYAVNTESALLERYVYSNNQLPSITVISPNGGETLQKGSLYEIKWTSNIAASSSVTIYVKRCSSCAEEVARVPNIGSYLWTVDPISPWSPVGQPGYQIAIYGGDYRGSADDTSDGYFNISTTSKIVSQLNPASPIPSTVIISPTTVTDNVVLGVFDFKSQNKDATLRSIKFKVWTSTSTVQTAFNTIKIKIGSTTYYPSSIAQSGAYAVVTYTNLAVPMPASQFVPIIVYGTVAPDRTGVMNGARVAVNILASNSTVYADDATFTQVPVAQTELTSSDLTFATAATKSITLNKLVLSSSYHVGDIIPIKWSSTNVNNVVINLMNYKGLSVVRFIASSTASVGQYNWTVPSNIDFNYDTIYTIAVSDAATPSIISKSGKIELLPATPNASPVAISNQVTSFVPLVTPNGTTGGNATFAFTLTAGSNPIYISRTASGVMTLVPVGMTVSINSVTAEPAGVSGDSNSSFVIPAGTSRRFTYNAFLDNSNGTTGQKLVSIQSIIYGMTAANPNGYQISSGLDNLKLSVNLNSNGTPPPVTALSARLTVEGQHTYTYTVGQTNHIAWLGSGPSGTVYSSYSKANDVGKCGEGPWVANNAQGTSNTYLTGQWAGCIWTITYVAKNPATGQTMMDTITVNVVSQAPQQPVSVTNTTTTFTPMVNQSGLIGGAFSMRFTLSAGSSPLYISKTASGVMFSVPVGLALSVDSVEADPAAITSDSPGAYVIPAGSSRKFTYFGSFDNSNGTTGPKLIQINSIVYGTSSANPTGYQISTGLEGLKIVQTLVGGAAPSIPSPTASITIEGQKSYTYTVGQTNHFVWSGSGPSGTVYSSYSKANDVGKCGEGAWVANNAQGTSNTYLTGQWAGCTWTVTYVATNPATGQSVQDSVTVSVVSQSTPPPTSTTTSYYPSNYGAAIINALTRLLGL